MRQDCPCYYNTYKLQAYKQDWTLEGYEGLMMCKSLSNRGFGEAEKSTDGGQRTHQHAKEQTRMDRTDSLIERFVQRPPPKNTRDTDLLDTDRNKNVSGGSFTGTGSRRTRDLDIEIDVDTSEGRAQLGKGCAVLLQCQRKKRQKGKSYSCETQG